jgi:hypothetical protein
MDFVRRILEFFQNKNEASSDEFCSFLHELKEDGLQYVITVHAESDGYLVFCMLSKSEWDMIVDICQLTSRNVEEMIRELSNNNEITNIVIDPRDIS